MEILPLSTTTFDEIINCFLKAFENYFVPLPKDKARYKQRWAIAKVDYSLSYGMFDKGNLIGFILHAIDFRNGHLTAYNTGTGVLPEYRGKKISQFIYQHAFADLKEKGITKFKLEVIQENEIAIAVYQKIGFEITKNYKCYAGELKTKHNQIILEELPLQTVNWDQLPNQNYYSWDNQSATVKEGNYAYFQILNEGTPESYFIIDKATGYSPQLNILNNNMGNWERLFSAISQTSQQLKISNVDDRLIAKIEAIENVGLINTVDQFEMEMDLERMLRYLSNNS